MVVDGRLNPNAEIAGIHQAQGVLTGKCPTSIRWHPSTPKMDRLGGEIVTRNCSPVGDS